MNVPEIKKLLDEYRDSKYSHGNEFFEGKWLGFSEAVELLLPCLEALERINEMCGDSSQCKCGRPTGVPALKQCSSQALADLEQKLKGPA